MLDRAIVFSVTGPHPSRIRAPVKSRNPSIATDTVVT